MNKREYVPCGDGECKFTERCYNYNSDNCYVCMFNTGATTRDFFEGEEDLSDEERDMIES
ncbi:hypothetical protein K144316041_p21510 (plasmid) [Clostridium tetani]|uniref:hypothetical protein n=1 Tax=Clostridium tetani TaxID=1513 RepID=UPI00295443AC|nr:hypothetical protein [Clostridium tetani]BDR74312.1 hypothetical protein K144316041_p21510 [Clostridium tetani]